MDRHVRTAPFLPTESVPPGDLHPKGLDPGLPDPAGSLVKPPAPIPAAEHAAHSLSAGANFDRKLILERAIPFQGVPFGSTEDGAIVLGHPDKADTVSIMPLGPGDTWIRIYSDRGISGQGDDRYMSYLIGTFQDMARDILESFSDLQVYQGADLLEAQGLCSKDGGLIDVPEEEVGVYLKRKDLSGEGLLLDSARAEDAKALKGISRFFTPRELEAAGLDPCGEDYRLNDGVLEIRFPVTVRGENCPPEEEWQVPDPFDGHPQEVEVATRAIKDFMERTLKGEASRDKKFEDLMESARDRRTGLEQTREAACSLALEGMGAWLCRAGWGTAQFNLWCDNDGRFGWDFFEGGREGEFPTLDGPKGEEDFESLLQHYFAALPESGTYTFDGEHLVEGLQTLPE